MINFTKEQITDIIGKYQQGKSLKEIGLQYNVSRPTIQKVVKNNYPAYTGKKRAIKAKDGQTKICSKCGRELPLDAFNKGNSLYGRRSFCRECEHKIQNNPDYRKRRKEKQKEKMEDKEYRKNKYLVDTIRRHNNEKSIKLSLLRSAKQRAKRKGLEFNIDISDITLPSKCPLLGIPLVTAYGKAVSNSYSIEIE